MISIFYILVLLYALMCLLFLVVWLKPHAFQNSKSLETRKFSILVPVRNEADNLHRLILSFANLNYPKDQFEVIFIDDFSTDNTLKIISNYKASLEVDIKIIENDAAESGSPKKRALSKAIGVAQFGYIITTDGDCEVPPNWLESFNSVYEQTSAKFISGPVTFFNTSKENILAKFWNSVQVIEFASLMGSGACSIRLGVPNMCSGANISYLKDTFNEVGGYSGNEHIASGDDEFLLHKIATKYPKSIQFLKNSEAIVLTESQKSLGSFYSQRKRWASKWNSYKDFAPKALAVFIFSLNLCTVFCLLAGIWQVLLIRFIPEAIFLVMLVMFLGKKKSLWTLFPLQLLYPFYVVIMGMSSLFKSGYKWKERDLT